jgi:hypothetical protein
MLVVQRKKMTEIAEFYYLIALKAAISSGLPFLQVGQ